MDQIDPRNDPTLLGNDRPRDPDSVREDDDREMRADLGDRGGVLRDDDRSTTADHVGEAAGGISGALTGAAIGSAGGPIGTVIGGIAGAIGGWWAGRAIAEAAERYTDADEEYYRSHYDTSSRIADRRYDDARPAYQLGHIASMNPEYEGRGFDEIEPDLRHGWTADVRSRYGEWDSVREYARAAYARPRVTPGTTPGTGDYAAGRAGDIGDPTASGRAVGDGTSVTGYAFGVEGDINDQAFDNRLPPSAADRASESLGDTDSAPDRDPRRT